MMKIAKSSSFLAVSSSNILCVLDLNTKHYAKVELEPPKTTSESKKSELKPQPNGILSLAVSEQGQQIAVATQSKTVSIFNRNLEIQYNIQTSRLPTKIVLKDNQLIVADKTGDVYLYDVETNTPPSILLGHLGTILDCDLSPCGKYIVTCDRDEKIRVSKFPNAYNIVSYCLGHTEFVVAVKIVGNVLFSAAGDGTVRIWNYETGQQINVIDTNTYLEDKSVVEQFKAEMQHEKIFISALPITAMQVFAYSDQCIFMAVTLFSVEAIQIYRIEPRSWNVSFVKAIPLTNSTHFTFLLDEFLFIFSESQVLLYQRLVNDFVEVKLDVEMQNFCETYRDCLNTNDFSYDIITMYKRKFDNVQEYLQRKRLRLEGNNKTVAFYSSFIHSSYTKLVYVQ